LVFVTEQGTNSMERMALVFARRYAARLTTTTSRSLNRDTIRPLYTHTDKPQRHYILRRTKIQSSSVLATKKSVLRIARELTPFG
jgi:hypothetical protein